MEANYSCRICGDAITRQKDNIVKSHAITNASFWKKIPIEPGGHLHSISPTSSQLENPSANGVTEKNILCRGCDNKISKYEAEREKLFSSYVDFKGAEIAPIDTALNQDYIKLAFLADLLRCSLFTAKNYKDINIGTKHEQTIIDMLNSGDPGELENLSVSIGKYDNHPEFGELAQLPTPLRLEGRKLFKTIYPGLWCSIVKVDSQTYPVLAEHSLGAGGDAFIVNMHDIQSDGTFKGVLSNVARLARDSKI